MALFLVGTVLGMKVLVAYRNATAGAACGLHFYSGNLDITQLATAYHLYGGLWQ